MKALTLTQPWASLVALGEKRIETRSWRSNYRGPLAIHAAGLYPGWAKKLERQEPFSSALSPGGIYCYPELSCGSVLCIVQLLDIYPIVNVRDQLSEKERAFGNYADGRFAWMLSAPVEKFDPCRFPFMGHLRLWNWER
jgi:hypothetical protein